MEVNIGKGNFQPTPIAIPDFAAIGVDPQMARQITDVVRSDLESTGLFVVTPQAAYIQKDLDIEVAPRFADWKVIKTDALAVGTVEKVSRDGTEFLRGSIRLWDVFGEELMRLDGQPGRRFRTEPEDWRRIAHKISDAIYTRLTGETGYFDTRIVYIAETGPKGARIKRLAIMDSDGANHRFITSGRSTALTPRYSPDYSKLAYLSYEDGNPRIYIYDIASGQQVLVTESSNPTFAPRWSPDGQYILYSMAIGGNTDIYRVPVTGGRPLRLTDSPGIDVGGSYSPDGSRIVFESDRSGEQQIYVMNADGTGQRRISFFGGRAGTPEWSPRGDQIAFTRIAGDFNIAVMTPEGRNLRVLTDAWQDEAPTWAPNGRIIQFFRTQRGGGETSIWQVDLTGQNERRLPTPVGASDPAWGPVLP